MASATMPRVGDEIRLEYGISQVFCLKFITGKAVQSRFPGGRCMFTAVDDRKLFLDDEETGDLERGCRDLGIRAGEDFIRVTKVRYPRGGGHAIRVERVDEPDDPGTLSVPRRPPAAAPRETIAEKLERSVRIAREQGAAAFITQPPRPPAAPPVATEAPMPAAADMIAAMQAAVDAIVETQAYAQRRGLGVTFSEESVRAIGLSIYIGAQRAGSR